MLISLSVALNSLVSFKRNEPIQVVDVVLQPIFDAMDQSFRRVSRYLATAEAFMERTQLISTLHREEFTSDSVL